MAHEINYNTLVKDVNTECRCGHPRCAHDASDIFHRCTLCSCWQYRCARLSDGSFDTEDKDLPICPHCGQVIDDWWDYSWPHSGDEAEIQIGCPSCDQEFKVVMRVTYAFTSAKLDDDQKAAQDQDY